MNQEQEEDIFLEHIRFLSAQLYKSTKLAKEYSGEVRSEHTEDIKLCIELINQAIKNFEHTKRAPNSGN